MKRLNEYIREDHKFLVKSKPKKGITEYKYFPKDKDELISVIEEKIKNEGDNCDLNDIDVSELTDLYGVFSSSSEFNGSELRGHFNGDISMWDVSNVTTMTNMFRGSDFNGDISNWDVSNVEDMRSMFLYSVFNGDISNWNVSNVTCMNFMFADSKFNQDISKWKVTTNANMINTFVRCPLENNPPKWYKK